MITFLFLAGAALAYTPTQFDFTAESSLEWVHFFDSESEAEEATCSAEIIRPEGNEAPSESADNRIICKAGDKETIHSLENDQVDRWGTHFETGHFSFKGEFADQLTGMFKVKTNHLSETDSRNSIWSRFGICDPNGNVCLITYSLNSKAVENSAGQVLCSQETELQSEPHAFPDSSEYAGRPTQYLQDYVDGQLAEGSRFIVKHDCVVLK